jgi:hypothetical protein
MLIVTFIIYIFLSYGISNILVFAAGPFHIFKFYRENIGKIHPHLEEVANCMICTPTWVGIILSLVNIFLVPNFPFTPYNEIIRNKDFWLLIILLDGCTTSGLVWILHTFQEMCERLGLSDENIIDSKEDE